MRRPTWMFQLMLAVSCPTWSATSPVWGQNRLTDSVRVRVGDGTVTGLQLRPYTRLFTAEWVPYGSSEGNTSNEISSVVDRLGLHVINGDTVLLRVIEKRWKRGTGVDSVAYEPQTMAPLWARWHFSRESSRYGFRGSRVSWSHIGPTGEQESRDSILPGRAFLETSMDVVLEATAPDFDVGRVFEIPMVAFDQYRGILLSRPVDVHVSGVDSLSAARGHRPSRATPVVVDDTYWIDRASHKPLMWEEHLEGGKQVYRLRCSAPREYSGRDQQGCQAESGPLR